MLNVISHRSSLEYWRKAQAKTALAAKRSGAGSLSKKPARNKTWQKDIPLMLSTPLHILVGSANARKVSKNIQSHICSPLLPASSLVKLNKTLAVSSPELCFLQMGSELPLVELIALGYELCGNYRLGNDEAVGRGFRDDLPLTSKAKLTAFLTCAANIKGRKNALRAVRYIADNSASPMETILSIVLTLPYKLGGYGFETPLLNYPIKAISYINKSKGRSQYYCDLFWLSKKVAVEYDSDTFHTGPERITQDAIRRNALSTVGVTVITVSKRQINDTAELREIAEVLRRLLDKRLKYPVPEFIARHADLRMRLLPRISHNN